MKIQFPLEHQKSISIDHDQYLTRSGLLTDLRRDRGCETVKMSLTCTIVKYPNSQIGRRATKVEAIKDFQDNHFFKDKPIFFSYINKNINDYIKFYISMHFVA